MAAAGSAWWWGRSKHWREAWHRLHVGPVDYVFRDCVFDGGSVLDDRRANNHVQVGGGALLIRIGRDRFLMQNACVRPC